MVACSTSERGQVQVSTQDSSQQNGRENSGTELPTEPAVTDLAVGQMVLSGIDIFASA